MTLYEVKANRLFTVNGDSLFLWFGNTVKHK